MWMRNLWERPCASMQDKNADRNAPPQDPDGGTTPIPISPRVLAASVVLVLVLFVLFLRSAPGVVAITLGGGALALILSIPVRALSRLVPRGLAILATVSVLLGVFALALVFLVPLLIGQLGDLTFSLPGIASDLDRDFRGLLRSLEENGTLPVTADEVLSRIGQDLLGRVEALARQLLTGLTGFVSSAFNFGVLLFGAVFVAIYLLVDARRVKAAYLKAAPQRYRRDAGKLWRALDVSLSRYLGGLALILVAQGVLSGVALWVLGVSYPLLLGVWVSVTAVIPILGAFLGAVPALILALFESPTTAVLTAVAFFAIQQFESNVLTPRVHGQAVRVHPIIVLLAVVGGGQVAGLTGAILAVPALAILRVLLDFFRPRLYLRR